jgi:hypothetical protein
MNQRNSKAKMKRMLWQEKYSGICRPQPSERLLFHNLSLGVRGETPASDRLDGDLHQEVLIQGQHHVRLVQPDEAV